MLRNTFLKLRTIPRRPRSATLIPLQYADQIMPQRLFTTATCAYCAPPKGTEAKANESATSPKKQSAFMPRGAPACVWNHLHETDPSQGHYFRVFYNNGLAYFQYFPQDKTRETVRATLPVREDGSQPVTPALSLCDTMKRTTLEMPTPFILRFLAVLDGTMASTEIVMRHAQGTFSGDYKSYKFEISCNSTLPDGKSLTWKVPFTPGESIVLQRFLTLALEKNYGFTRHGDGNNNRRHNRNRGRR